ncbi:N-acetylmuramoyl-L-alanine amidase family protein [Victivallis sp. Marseille-Q1083]|uniref:peptidoglycan recognition protein family protein n=1 Tax=Victivallis sp. Marseille-Q1083 TaxID=2717288 RepID=UPI00158BAA0C|nr:N-acetylmuramoyl-L-alanine amidase [Victivallis sp. Marseille-Q1083]
MKSFSWLLASSAAMLSLCFGTGCAVDQWGNYMQSAFDSDLEMRNGVLVQQQLLDDNEYNNQYKRPGPMKELKYVTIHNTYNFGPAINERNYLNNRRDKAYISFHYAVDENGAIQILRDDERGWHAGDGDGPGNANSIAIEICRSRCYDDRDGEYRGAEANAVKLAAWLLDRYQLSDEALKMHQDWSGKFCPHRILEEQRWDEFKARVKAARRH